MVIHIISPPGAGKGLVIKLMRERTKDLPETEFRKLRSWVVYFHEGWAIIKVSQEGSALMMGILEGLKGVPMRDGRFDFNIAGVSGTLKKAFQKYVPEIVREGRHYHEDLSSES